MRPLGLRLLSASLLAACCAFSGSARAVEYSGAGPHKTLTKNIAGVDGLSGQIAYPDTTGGNYPVIILAHGFASGADRMIGWGEHLASHGFVSVSLRNCGGGFVCTPDPNVEAGLVQKALAYVESGVAPEGVTDQADASRFLLLGHSAGGQAVTVAASKIEPTGVVLFDPVGGGQSASDAEPAKTALSSVCSPVLTVFAEPHETGSGPFAQPSCNKKGAWQSFAGASTGPAVSVVVKGSTHCDGELPARTECAFPCGGGANANRQKAYRHYATAFALAVLEKNADAAAALVPSALEADSRVKDGKTTSGTACEGSGAGGASGGTGGTSGEGGSSAGSAGSSAGGATGEEGGTSAAGGSDATGGSAGDPTPGGAGTAGGPAEMGGGPSAGGGGAKTGDGGAAGAPIGAAGLGGQSTAGAAGNNNTTSLGIDEDSACGCHVPGAPSGPASAAGLFALAAALLGRRRKG